MKQKYPRQDVKYCHLNNLEVYHDDGRYYLKATYRVEQSDGIYELVIPKIQTPFTVLCSVGIVEDNGNSGLNQMSRTIYWLKTGGESIRMLPDENSSFYNLKLLESKVVEMTIEEIEKRLGHAIKIIKEK